MLSGVALHGSARRGLSSNRSTQLPPKGAFLRSCCRLIYGSFDRRTVRIGGVSGTVGDCSIYAEVRLCESSQYCASLSIFSSTKNKAFDELRRDVDFFKWIDGDSRTNSVSCYQLARC